MLNLDVTRQNAYLQYMTKSIPARAGALGLMLIPTPDSNPKLPKLSELLYDV